MCPSYCVLICLQCQKCASLPNQTLSWKSGSSSILFSNHWHINKCFSMSAGVILCLIWSLYGYSWISFFFKYSLQRCTWKTMFFGTSSEILFRTLSHIFRTPSSQLPARSGIFCLLLKVVYLSRDLKFGYPAINLTFLGIIIKVKLPVKFYLHSF